MLMLVIRRTTAYRRGGVVMIALALLAVLPLRTPGALAGDQPEGLIPAPTRLGVLDPAQANGAEMASLSIPAIGVKETVRSGIAMSVIDKGPAHWVGTSVPGGSGNVVLAGHRTTKTRPFFDLNRLETGDLIIFSGVLSPDGFPAVAVYSVTETLIVDSRAIWITYETGEAIVTLFACHAKGSVRQRIVVRGALVATTTLRGLPGPGRPGIESLLGAAFRPGSRF